ncbi:solute carrier family 12 member 2-like isoform X2 [Centruroides vittatus]|uniref:solute carrier family 12 member 2-like isoform X2 n=1 Tax=Centruroides vittatus TaxID=120091 RepID=UPI0035105A38
MSEEKSTDSNNYQSNWIEMDKKDDNLKPPSRFKVAKVDFDVENQDQSVADDRNEEGTYQLQLTHNSNYSNSYDTHNLKSLRQYTREALPRLDHYRNILSIHAHISRPTLDELHLGNGSIVGDHNWQKPVEKSPKQAEQITKTAVKFGWIQGVLVRCLLNIWGVMLFLRLSWVVGQAGIGLGCVVVLLATVVTVITSLSMSAICTNGEVKGGGTYYMISRSLGPEFGGSIGLIFALANAVAVAMYVVGFAETVTDVMLENKAQIFETKMNDMRIISCVTVVFLLGIAIIGTEWETKAQIVLLLILLSAMGNFIIGSLLTPTDAQIAQGFVGWNLELGAENFMPGFRDGEDFFSVFAVFFPAATGILAGANISGDLKDPQKSIPRGTLLAILLTTISYLLFAVAVGSTVYRDANGMVEFVHNNTLHLLRNCSLGEKGVCPYGLIPYYQTMKLVAAFDPLIYAGIFAATLSSALASLVSAPKVFQALCKDKLFPYIHVFAKGYGKNGEPRRGYVLTFIIALACCAIGELNAIAPIISNFFLAAYCLINFSCFHASFSRSPGFRPSFKYYNMWLSLLGAILCLVIMFIIKWWAALTTFAVVQALFIYIYYRKPDVNWGSSTQAQMYQMALNAVIKLNLVPDHVKNYRPQILVLTGSPNNRPPLVDFAYTISKKLSLMVCGHVLIGNHSQKTKAVLSQQAYQWLQKRKVKSFYAVVQEDSFSHGVSSLTQLVGIGKLKPNVILMGYKSNWQECEPSEVLEYFNVIHDAFDMHMSLGILRLKEGLDYSEYADAEELAIPITNDKSSSFPVQIGIPENTIGRNISCSQLSQAESSRESSPPSTPSVQRIQKSEGVSHNPLGQSPSVINNSQYLKSPEKDIPKEILMSANQFQRKQKKGTIDVWWLYDDGGLTMLIPYLLTTRSQWGSCKLRIFALANKKDELDREQRNMAALLSKFRIDYSDVTVIPDVTKSPQDSSKKEFENIIQKWKHNTENKDNSLITEAELLALKDKSNRHMRLRELLLQHSNEAALIVMTLPMPRKSTCSAPLYMAWLEMLTRDMPPFLLIRGNQTSVLTFYS